MKQIQSNTSNNTKKHVVDICDELAKHSSTIDEIIRDEGVIDNPVIQGHIEVHLEKIDDSLLEIYNKYEISKSRLSNSNQSKLEPMNTEMQNQKTVMKLLQGNLQRIEAKVRSIMPNTAGRSHLSQESPLRELSRKLKNDLCRTVYLLQ